MTFLKTMVHGILQTSKDEPNQYKVLDMKKEQLANYRAISENDGVTLYANGNTGTYELIINLETQKYYSLCRILSEDEAAKVFKNISKFLPSLLPYIPGSNFKNTLEEMFWVITLNPSWKLIHIAAHCNLPDFFDNCLSEINQRLEDTLASPLHISLKAGKEQAAKHLLLRGGDVNMMDRNANTVFHYAAFSSENIIRMLCSHSCASALINKRNNDGYTPLHIACMEERSDCVIELLKSGADQNSACLQPNKMLSYTDVDVRRSVSEALEEQEINLDYSDMKYGGNALHWAETTDCIEAMIGVGCDKNARNLMGNTPLHLMIFRNRLSCVMSLLCHMADINAPGKNGNAPLHLAVRSGEISLVQALVVLGADVNVVNENNENARHILSRIEHSERKENILFVLHSMGVKRCSLKLPNCTESCSPDGNNNGTAPEGFSAHRGEKFFDKILGKRAIEEALAQKRKDVQVFRAKNRCRVLCLDGGGIRGLLLTQMLLVMESILKAPIIKFFDWIAGTSTGGMLALALALGKSTNECRSLYLRLKTKVFVGSRPYKSENLEKFLKKEFGEHTLMSNITEKKVMVTSVVGDKHPAFLHLFRNYESPLSILGEEDQHQIAYTVEPSKQLVWEAARATGSAPTYFRASGSFLDGGLIANNPTLDALTEIYQYNEAIKLKNTEETADKIEIIVSLGTGISPLTSVNTIDVFRPVSPWEAAKLAKGFIALGQLVLDQVTQSNGRVVDRAKAWCSMSNIPYFRLNTPLSEEVGIDEVDDEVLVKIMWEATVYMFSHRAELEMIVELLK